MREQEKHQRYICTPREALTLIATQDHLWLADCVTCVESCHFGARLQRDSQLVLQRDFCSNCGPCVEACPQDATGMVPR